MSLQLRQQLGKQQERTIDSELQLDVYGPNITSLSATQHASFPPVVSPCTTLSLQSPSSLEDYYPSRYGPEGPLFGRLCDDLLAHLISFIPSVQDRAAFREVATRWRRIINETPDLWRIVSCSVHCMEWLCHCCLRRLHFVVSQQETDYTRF